MKKENIYIDLSKCSEEEQKHIFSLLPESLSSLQYEIDEYNFMLDYEDDEWWVNGTKPPIYKTELTYPEFIKLFEGETCPKCRTKDFENCHSIRCPMRDEKLFEGSEGENNGWIKIESESDLPKEKGNYLVFTVNSEIETMYADGDISALKHTSQSWMRHFTHYQPIVKPEPPKF